MADSEKVFADAAAMYPAEGAMLAVLRLHRQRDVLLKALKEARGMLLVAMRVDLPGWSKEERRRMIASNPGMKIINAALALAEGTHRG